MPVKIEVEIPDFIPPERIIFILAGTNECIGWVEPHTRKVHTKISQCSRCGLCCKRMECPSLKYTEGVGYSCIHFPSIPVVCATNDGLKRINTCTSKFN